MEAGRLIRSAKSLTGFYMMGTLTLNVMLCRFHHLLFIHTKYLAVRYLY